MFNKTKGKVTSKAYEASSNGNYNGGANFRDFMNAQKAGLERWKPQEGVNKIDVIPYNATESHPLVQTGQMEVGDGLYSFDIMVHRGIGPSGSNIICLKQFGKNCPICNECNRLRNSDREEDKKKNSEMYARRRVVYVIHDLINNKYGYWDTGYKSVEEPLQQLAAFETDANGAKISVMDWEEGRTIQFMGVKKSYQGHSYIEASGFNFKERQPLSDDVLAHSVDLSTVMNLTSEEEMEKLLSGQVVSSATASSEPAPKAETTVDETDELDPYSQPAQKAEAQTTATAQAPAPKPTSDKVCPCGHKWGEADSHDECATCEVWDKCIDG